MYPPLSSLVKEQDGKLWARKKYEVLVSFTTEDVALGGMEERMRTLPQSAAWLKKVAFDDKVYREELAPDYSQLEWQLDVVLRVKWFCFGDWTETDYHVRKCPDNCSCSPP